MTEDVDVRHTSFLPWLVENNIKIPGGDVVFHITTAPFVYNLDPGSVVILPSVAHMLLSGLDNKQVSHTIKHPSDRYIYAVDVRDAMFFLCMGAYTETCTHY